MVPWRSIPRLRQRGFGRVGLVCQGNALEPQRWSGECIHFLPDAVLVWSPAADVLRLSGTFARVGRPGGQVHLVLEKHAMKPLGPDSLRIQTEFPLGHGHES